MLSRGTLIFVIIDRDAEDFPFEQLAAILRGRIEDGTYLPGSRLPTHLALEAESGLSPMTVRRAVRLLSEQGWVRTRRGRGTFVVPPEQRPKQD
jgi:GntR family transcriptional regulator